MIKDPYTIDEEGTLRNKLGITDYAVLKAAERDITASKFLNIDKTFGNSFDSEYFKAIHKHIFEDVFDWAGEFRTVPVIKQEIVIPGLSLQYAAPKDIPKKLEKCLKSFNDVDWESLPLDKKVPLFTSKLVELWSIHPFRDGNTRTTITFARQFSKEHGFPMDLGYLLDQLPRKFNGNRITQYSIRDKFVLAAIPKEHYPEPEHLESLIHQSIVSDINKNRTEPQNQLDTLDER